MSADASTDKGKRHMASFLSGVPGAQRESERARFPSDTFLLASSTGKIFCMPHKTKMFAFPPIQG